MNIVSGITVSQTISRAFDLVASKGIKQPTRNGHAMAIFDTTFEFTNPRARHLFLQGRKSNIFQMIAETFWVMAGANAVSPYLDFFLPRAANYSDDGNTWHGAYGPRMYAYNQMQDAIKAFKLDGVNTRRSFVTISMPHMDCGNSIDELYGQGHVAKDIPCNREIQFYVEDGSFHAKVIQRSGDLLFGTGSINPFEFSFIHELMYNEVVKLYPEVTLGAYRWHVTNAHVYSDFQDQFEAVVNSDQMYRENTIPLVGPNGGVESWEHFFSSLVAHLTYFISGDNLETWSINANRDDIDSLMNAAGVPTNSLLREYVELTIAYILSKRGVEVKHNIGKLLEGDLLDAVLHSPFRKFTITE